MKKIIGLFLTSFLIQNFSFSVILREGYSQSQSQAYANNANLDSICWIGITFSDKSAKTGTGVLIAPNKILMAAHTLNGGKDVLLNEPGVIFYRNGKPPIIGTINRIIVHPKINMIGDFCYGTDLAILVLNEVIQDIKPMKLNDDIINFDSKQLYIVGYGSSGTNETGISIHDEEPKRRLAMLKPSFHLGNQYIEYQHACKGIAHTFEISHDSSKFEGIPTVGDSGSPLFVGNTTSGYKLIGIYHGGEVVTANALVCFSTQQWIPIFPHLNWIRQNVQ